MRNPGSGCFTSVKALSLLVTVMAALLAASPLCSQSNRSLNLIDAGAWRLHSRIPLGSDAVVLNPAHRVLEMLATVEAPEFEGWSVTQQHGQPVLIDGSGKPVNALPQSITFRVTVSTRDKLSHLDPMGFACSKDVNELLLDMHFEVQIFRGMQMTEVHPARVWMIGIPADEPSEERVYRAAFNFADVRPDDRIALIVTDSNGARLTKFHLEFL